MPHLTATGLEKRFGRRLLFRDLSFDLEGGQTLAVTGSNGTGKSTLLRILGGVMAPSAGKVALRVNGTSLSPVDHPLRVGLVAPYLNVYEGFSPRENLEFVAKARRLPRSRAAIDDALAFTGLSGRADDLVATFSSGMKQRVKYGAALLADPPLLLLDEPNVNLDAAGLEMVGQVVARQHERDGLLVIATNDEREAERYDHRIRIESFHP